MAVRVAAERGKCAQCKEKKRASAQCIVKNFMSGWWAVSEPAAGCDLEVTCAGGVTRMKALEGSLAVKRRAVEWMVEGHNIERGLQLAAVLLMTERTEAESRKQEVWQTETV